MNKLPRMGRPAVKTLLTIFAAIASIGLVACGTHSGSAGTAPTQASPAPDAENAYRQLHDANNVSDCGASVSALSDANTKHDVPALRITAAKYRAQVAAWDDLLAKIAFPPSAMPIVDSLRASNAHELQELDSIAAVTETPHGNLLATYVFYDNARGTTDLDRLAEALGHRSSGPLVAADQLELARQTYQRDNALTEMLFSAALAHADLDAAKAANRVEEDGLARYAEALNKIAWPTGFDGQVNDLRDKIRALIDYDRRQVDVSNVSQVVPAPRDGSPEGAAESLAQGNLLDALYKANKADTLLKC
jgi:hypothetical protein